LLQLFFITSRNTTVKYVMTAARKVSAARELISIAKNRQLRCMRIHISFLERALLYLGLWLFYFYIHTFF